MTGVIAEHGLVALDGVVVALAILVEQSEVHHRVGVHEPALDAALVGGDGVIVGLIGVRAVNLDQVAQAEKRLGVLLILLRRLPVLRDGRGVLTASLFVHPSVIVKVGGVRVDGLDALQETLGRLRVTESALDHDEQVSDGQEVGELLVRGARDIPRLGQIAALEVGAREMISTPWLRLLRGQSLGRAVGIGHEQGAVALQDRRGPLRADRLLNRVPIVHQASQLVESRVRLETGVRDGVKTLVRQFGGADARQNVDKLFRADFSGDFRVGFFQDRLHKAVLRPEFSTMKISQEI